MTSRVCDPAQSALTLPAAAAAHADDDSAVGQQILTWLNPLRGLFFLSVPPKHARAIPAKRSAEREPFTAHCQAFAIGGNPLDPSLVSWGSGNTAPELQLHFLMARTTAQEARLPL